MNWVGVEVTEDHACFQPVGTIRYVANDEEGIERAIERLPRKAQLVFAAKPRLDRTLVKKLKAAKVPFMRLKPSRIRPLARGLGYPPGTAELSPVVLRELGVALQLAALSRCEIVPDAPTTEGAR